MTIAVVSGAASGIGAAVRQQFIDAGMRVIGIDLKNSDVCADLSTDAGRRSAIESVHRLTGGTIDRLVCCAGLGPQVEPVARIAAVNYFGVIALLDGLFDMLKTGEQASAIVVSSSSATLQSWAGSPLRDAYLADDEAKVYQLLAGLPAEQAGYAAYASSKNAVAVAVRQRAVAWGAAQVRLNAIAPGAVQTPLLEAGLNDPRYGEAIRTFVAPIGGRAQPGEIAALVGFLAGNSTPFIHGSVLFVDGGIDAAARPFDF